MVRLTLACVVVTASTSALAGMAWAAPSDNPDRPVQLALLADPAAMPAAAESAPDAPARAGSVAGVPVAAAALDEAPIHPPDVAYGVGARVRWVTVPSWVLNLFTKQNVPLSTFAVAGEVFRRKGKFQVGVSLGYQNMSPADGNWLGKNRDAAIDTDFVQFRGLELWTADVSFTRHDEFTDWFGIHYGAGIGLGLLRGQILRTSNGSGCTDANAGNERLCHPIGVDPSSNIPVDRQIQALGPGVDDPNDPHRFADDNKPPVIPVVSLVLGVDFRVPQVKGWAAKLEGGFYDAFFLGGGAAYTF